MHQFMFIFICMFMVFKKTKTLISMKEIKKKQNKIEEIDVYRYEN